MEKGLFSETIPNSDGAGRGFLNTLFLQHFFSCNTDNLYIYIQVIPYVASMKDLCSDSRESEIQKPTYEKTNRRPNNNCPKPREEGPSS